VSNTSIICAGIGKIFSETACGEGYIPPTNIYIVKLLPFEDYFYPKKMVNEHIGTVPECLWEMFALGSK